MPPRFRDATPAPAAPRSFVAVRPGGARLEYRIGDVVAEGHPLLALRPQHFRAVEQRIPETVQEVPAGEITVAFSHGMAPTDVAGMLSEAEAGTKREGSI